MFAVDPEQVRAGAVRMTAKEILAALQKLPEGPGIVILSGGNPALHDLTDLVRTLQTKGHLMVHVETQGSVWRPWLGQVDKLIISPKPPSSGMVSEAHDVQFGGFMGHVYEAPRVGSTWCALKVVVADEIDYAWAQGVHATYPEVPFYLSVMTPQDDLARIDDGTTYDDHVRLSVATGYKWLCERAQSDATMADAVVLPQLHVIAHGAMRGV
jgi:7-carboxy-7-deazaguanine synthase